MTVQAARDPAAFRDFERDGWQRASAAYEDYWGRVTAQTVAPLLDAAGVGAGTALLDVCCGPGTLARVATERGATAHGIDLSDNFVATAARNCPAARFETGDAEALPFDDDRFDAAVCGYGIIHLPRPATALAEMARVVRPGGRVAASVWAGPEPGTGLGIAFAALKAHADMSVPLPHGPDFYQFSQPPALVAALAGAGLDDVSVARVEQTFDNRGRGGDALWAMITDAGVRMAGLLSAQTPERRAAVREALAAGVAALSDPDTLHMPALVASGRKPG